MTASNLFDRFERVARSRAQAPAVRDATGTVTYAELLDLATRFGDTLRDAGISPGDRVAVLLGNTRDFLTSCFGIWKCGAVLVPFNPQLQVGEMLKYLGDSQARGLISHVRNESLVDALSARGARFEHAWLCKADSAWAHRTSAPLSTSPASARADAETAVSMYSTGSTGYPKRSTRTHEQLYGEFSAVSGALPADAAERVLGVAPFFHSHGLMNAAMRALLTGGVLYACEGFFPKDIGRLVEREGISMLPMVPFMFQLLVEMQEKHDFSSVRTALSAGAPLSERTGTAFAERYGVAIRQLYGSTETGVISIVEAENSRVAPECVGVPIRGVLVRICDEAGQAVAEGSEGTVEITSPYAARAYDIEQRNSESFFSGDRFYPGDRGYLSRGNLFLVGRSRGFINVGGNKVDPSEVEAALLEMPAIKEAVVFGVPDPTGGEKVKAVLIANEPVSQLTVRSHCAGRLAEFKHPRVIEFRKELPRSPLGKILRKYLMDADPAGPAPFVSEPHATDESLKFDTLPPFLRVLLVTDGTVTKNMEAYFLEKIDVEIIAHTQTASEQDYPEVGVARGDSIVLRRVLLRGRVSRSVYAFAESILGCDKVAEDILNELMTHRLGIGELLRQRKLETLRELINVRRAQAGEWASHLAVRPDETVLVRHYTIGYSGRPMIRIQEIFPACRFE